MNRLSHCILAIWLTGILVLGATAGAAPATEYEIGGPLAGVQLPLMPTQHGEPAGHPGAVGNLARPPVPNSNLTFGVEGRAPVLELYPGSVENFQDYMDKYVPVRSFFDRQSQLRNWNAGDLPGVAAGEIESYAAPLFWVGRYSEVADTGLKLKPVAVARLRPGGTTIRLDLGELPAGLYAVRLIGAVGPAQVQPFRKPLVIRAEVNDGPGGEPGVYRLRAGYCEEFYDVADVYFHAPEKRAYHMTIQSDAASQVDFLLHNVSLDDVLAGTIRKPLKTRAIAASLPGVTPQPSKYSEPARRDRDGAIWNSYVPDNAPAGQFGGPGYGSIAGVTAGTGELTPEEIETRYGAWTLSDEPGVLMTNNKLHLRYTIDDLRQHRPLPGPYPFPDDGLGLTFPAPADPASGRVWAPIAFAVKQRIGSYLINPKSPDVKAWIEKGDADAARDAAVKLIRFAYEFPTFDDANTLNATVHDPAAFHRGFRCRTHESDANATFGGFGFQFIIAKGYDQLFSYIQGNEDLAQSIGRFVPTVKTSKDLIELLDVYLTQTVAKRFLRYQYLGDGREPAVLADVAAVMGNNAVTEPWMHWLFTRTFYYPRPLAGLPDYLVTATDREGRSTIGSTFYVMGDESAASIAEGTENYVRHGGDPRYDMADPHKFPKAISALYFPFRTRTAGLWFLGIGDVTGPDKDYTHGFDNLLGNRTNLGWKWTKDPQFAFVIRHYGKPDAWSPAEWQEIGKAAEKVRRAPWMDQRSRVLPGYAVVLEDGLIHDDWRFRRSAMVRVGTGTGHAQYDTLDLQIHAHGVPLTINPGQRGGYSTPGDRLTRVHNTVEVDGENWEGPTAGPANSWVQTLEDIDGARYLRARVAPNHLAKLAQRQVALIAVDEGRGSVPLGPEAYGPLPKGLPRDVTTANSYVFDVFRVDGGSTHTYCFHSEVNDVTGSNQPRHNVQSVTPVGNGSTNPTAVVAEKYLERFSGQRWYGTAPENLEIEFSLQKTRPKTAKINQAGTEARLLGAAYDPQAPDKFLRWHVLGVAGALVMKGDLNCHQWDYQIPDLFVQRYADAATGELQSAFAAILEPYAGKPFLLSARRLAIDGNESDARQAVAVEVKTVNGHTDLCFADGRPEKVRQFPISNLQSLPAVVGQISAEFAYYSTDTNGLRQASLTGGTILKTPTVILRAAAARRSARIVRVDYPNRLVWIDQVWPASRQERLLELRTQPVTNPASWRTEYTAASWEPEGDGTRIQMKLGADFFRSQISRIDPATGQVFTQLGLPCQASGFHQGWTASDDGARQVWRVKATDDGQFTLEGSPVRNDSFGSANVLRLWEYGVGDELSSATFVSLRRTEAGGYELTGDVDVELTWPDGAVRKVAATDLARGSVTIPAAR